MVDVVLIFAWLVGALVALGLTLLVLVIPCGALVVLARALVRRHREWYMREYERQRHRIEEEARAFDGRVEWNGRGPFERSQVEGR